MRRPKTRPTQESPRSAWLALADNLASAMVFVSFFVAHWIAQAMAWANASANTAWRLLFDLLAAPLIHLAGSRTDEYFLMLSVPNSLLWAAALTYLAARVRKRGERVRRAREN